MGTHSICIYIYMSIHEQMCFGENNESTSLIFRITLLKTMSFLPAERFNFKLFLGDKNSYTKYEQVEIFYSPKTIISTGGAKSSPLTVSPVSTVGSELSRWLFSTVRSTAVVLLLQQCRRM